MADSRTWLKQEPVGSNFSSSKISNTALDNSNVRGTSSSKVIRNSTKIPEVVKDPDFIVAIDFGTTFSGFSFAVFSEIQTKHGKQCDNVHLFEDWPCRMGTTYCKTQTSVWYISGLQPGNFTLKGWGWEGFEGYQKNLRKIREQEETSESSSEESESPHCSDHELDSGAGYLITHFKLGLDDNRSVSLPEGLSLERVITDFLEQMSLLIMDELETRFGCSVNKSQIRFCLTVPAIWTQAAKQVMKNCAEGAGLVRGPLCKDDKASCHELVIVVEPEAASVYCNQTLTVKEFNNGERFLVVDVGGGTVDLVVHEKVGSTTRSNIKVKEVRVSSGAAVGGCHVDDAFFDFLRREIPCFGWFESTYPDTTLQISRWWWDIKARFGGKASSKREFFELPLPPLLANRWARELQCKSSFKYSELKIQGDILEGLFDPVVNKILQLIEEHMKESIHAILLVGGFSNSPYLRKRIKDRFKGRVRDIVVPPSPGAAVLKGAVSFGVIKEWENLLKSRVAKLTYGFDSTCTFKAGTHPEKYMVLEKGTRKKKCDNIFRVLIKKGDSIPIKKVIKHTCEVFYSEDMDDEEDKIEITLYSTHSRNPHYITDRGVQKEATCRISVPPAKHVLAGFEEPKLEILLYFGSTTIRGFVRGKNYAAGSQFPMIPINFKWFNSATQ